MNDTTELTARLRELYAKATPGEWTLTGDPHMCCDCLGSLDFGTNAEFVAEAHNALPTLLDELERLQKLEAGLLGAIIRVGTAMNRDDE